ncbi:hypothetical protein Tco_0216845 [Tanacetum coccineum]
MADSSSHKPSSPEITPKEEPITLDKPESPNPFLPANQVEFIFKEIAFTTNNEVPLLYPSHPNSDYFREVSDFISKCCLKEAFIMPKTQYKEYLMVGEMHKEAQQAAGGSTSLGATSEDGAHPRLSSGIFHKLKLILDLSDPIDSDNHTQLRADEISKKIKLEDLSDLLKDTRFAFFTPDSPQDEHIVSDESEEEE